MPQPIVVVPINHGAGVTSACLGLAHALDERRVPVDYLKPFGRAGLDGDDTSAELFRLATALRPPPPIPFSHVEHELAQGREEQLMEEVVALSADAEGARGVIVVEGVAPGDRQVHSTRLNVGTARALDADVLLVASASGTTPERVADQMQSMARQYRVSGGSRVVGAVLNRIPPEENDGRYEQAVRARGFHVVASVPVRPEFARPRVLDLVHRLGLETLNAGDDRRRVAEVMVAAQSIPGFLPKLTDGRLVVVPGDRHEVLLAAALAEQNGTRLAALLVTAGVRPDPEVLRLCRPALQDGLPVLFTPETTFDVATRVAGLDVDVPADDEDRARLVMRGIAEAYDEDWLDELPRRERVRRVTPAAFRRAAVKAAAKGDTCIALTDAEDPRVIACAIRLQERGILRSLLLGDPAAVEAAAAAAGLEIPFGVRVLDPAGAEGGERRRLERLVADLAARTPGVADLEVTDPLVRGLDLVARGDVDGLVTGLTRSHDDVFGLAPAVLGLVVEGAVLSSAHVLNLPDEVVVYTDCLLHERPGADELAAIALAGAVAAENVGIVPRLAVVTGRPAAPGDEEHERVSGAVERIRHHRPDLQVEGPVTLTAAARRRPAAASGGNASVYVFADLATASATYRAVSREAGVAVQGPFLLGLTHPVNVVPPEATAEEISDLVVATALQAAWIG